MSAVEQLSLLYFIVLFNINSRTAREIRIFRMLVQNLIGGGSSVFSTNIFRVGRARRGGRRRMAIEVFLSECNFIRN